VQITPLEVQVDCPADHPACSKLKLLNYTGAILFNYGSPNYKIHYKSDEFVRSALTKTTNETFQSELNTVKAINTLAGDKGLSGEKKWGMQLTILEQNCLRSIEQSIIPGTFETDKEVRKRFKAECQRKNPGQESLVEISEKPIVGESEKKAPIAKITITKVRAEYTFFTGEDGKYKKDSQDVLEVSSNLVFETPTE
jgi:hypothetical protein